MLPVPLNTVSEPECQIGEGFRDQRQHDHAKHSDRQECHCGSRDCWRKYDHRDNGKVIGKPDEISVVGCRGSSEGLKKNEKRRFSSNH